jgi:prepilin-type N-terminal cleavage/methylation domain-containing protein/prepilin-type processing-associated H-X9-DG protein
VNFTPGAEFSRMAGIKMHAFSIKPGLAQPMLSEAVHCVETRRRDGAFTLVEMLVVIAIIAILAALLLPALIGGKQRAKRILCETQLQQMGIAFQSFSHDHNSKFPMQVSIADGGSQDVLQSESSTTGMFYIEYRYFQPLGSILETPRVLVCPTDTRLPALSFNVLQNSNVSYFVGVNAQYDQPMSILAGDGNLAASTTMLHVTTGGRLTWDSKLHEYKGNVLFADGHVEEWKDGTTTVSSRSEIILPTLGGSGGGGSGGSSSGMRTSASQPQAAGQGGVVSGSSGGANVPGTPLNPMAQGGPAASQASPSHSKLAPNMVASNARQDTTSTNIGQMELAETNPVAETVVATNVPPDAVVASPQDTHVTMSPANRKMASVLRDVLVGTWFLVLLALLVYAIYRIRRWRQEVERRRQFKIKLEAMKERYAAKR